jgi:hypothetical protein
MSDLKGDEEMRRNRTKREAEGGGRRRKEAEERDLRTDDIALCD